MAEAACSFGATVTPVMAAVREHGTPLVDDPERTGDVEDLGIGEAAWLAATATHHTLWATGLVDTRRGQLVDVIQGRERPSCADGWPTRGRTGWTAWPRCRPGAPRKITDDDVEAVVVKTLEEKPVNATHWSTRDLAKKSGMSASSVGRIWRAFGLKPWRSDTFKLSEDPMFVEKVRDLVGVYLNPPDKAVVLCVDEKTGIQALDRTQPILPMRPGPG